MARRHPRTGLSDTALEAERVHVDLLRQAGVTRRAELASSMTESTLARCMRGIQQANPGMSDIDVKLRFVEICYGKDLARRVKAYLGEKLHVEQP